MCYHVWPSNHSRLLNALRFLSMHLSIERKRCYQCFSFTRLHFSNFTFMEYDSTNQLNVVVNHVPRDFFSGCIPLNLPKLSLIAN